MIFEVREDAGPSRVSSRQLSQVSLIDWNSMFHRVEHDRAAFLCSGLWRRQLSEPDDAGAVSGTGLSRKT